MLNVSCQKGLSYCGLLGAGGDQRSLGLRLFPSISVGGNAERLMERLSASRAQSAALSEAAEEDQSPKVHLSPPSLHPLSCSAVVTV